jgi:hypothetical protein
MSEFLKKLKKAADEGNPEIAKDFISKVNEINDMADGVDTTEVSIDSINEKYHYHAKEHGKIGDDVSLGGYMEDNIKEEEKLKILAELKNAQRDLVNLTLEKEDAIEQTRKTYNLIIEKQSELIEKLEIKFNEVWEISK